MTPAEQLAEMALTNSMKHYEASNLVRLIEYHAVLRWFSDEIQRKAAEAAWQSGATDEGIVEAMRELIVELKIEREGE